MTDKALKSVITCDMEGRIETFNDGAAAVFGYPAEEIIGKKRVSLFSPGLVVLEHVENWLSSAVENGSHETDTVFIRKDGSRFAAHIKITPTYKNETQIGYCGVTVPLPDVDPETVMPTASLLVRMFRWLVITRAPFLTAMIVPIILASVMAASKRITGNCRATLRMVWMTASRTCGWR